MVLMVLAFFWEFWELRLILCPVDFFFLFRSKKPELFEPLKAGQSPKVCATTILPSLLSSLVRR
jgi:hypothetical protein